MIRHAILLPKVLHARSRAPTPLTHLSGWAPPALTASCSVSLAVPCPRLTWNMPGLPAPRDSGICLLPSQTFARPAPACRLELSSNVTSSQSLLHPFRSNELCAALTVPFVKWGFWHWWTLLRTSIYVLLEVIEVGGLRECKALGAHSPSEAPSTEEGGGLRSPRLPRFAGSAPPWPWHVAGEARSLKGNTPQALQVRITHRKFYLSAR